MGENNVGPNLSGLNNPSWVKITKRPNVWSTPLSASQQQQLQLQLQQQQLTLTHSERE